MKSFIQYRFFLNVYISVCKWINAITVSSIHDAENSTQSSIAGILHAGKQYKRDAVSSDRNRRLIPYMMFYIPAPSRQYLPVSNPYDIKPVVISLLFLVLTFIFSSFKNSHLTRYFIINLTSFF